jgi:hypothetical protein
MVKKRNGFIRNMAEFVHNIMEKVLAEDEGGVWRTINGSPIFIKDGQSVDDALKERFGSKGGAPISEAKASRLVNLIKNKGGFSYQPTFHTSPVGGFMVSPYREREQTIKLKDITPKDTLAYVMNNIDAFSKSDHYFDAWADGEDVYFDVSVRSGTKESATALAKKHNQLAIFDVKNLESIYLKKEGGDSNE